MLQVRSLTGRVRLLVLTATLLSLAAAVVRPWLGAAGAVVLALLVSGLVQRRLRAEIEALAQGRPVLDELQPVVALAASREAQARQELQAADDKRLQLEVLLEGMQDGVLGVDSGGRVAWTNAEMGRILDTHGLGAVIRMGRSLAHTLRDPALLELVDRVVEDRAPASLRTSTLLPGRIFDVNAAPLPNGGAVLVLRDVTRAEALERAQREFVANVSHELRTPLTSVRGYSETLLDSGLIAPEAEPWVEIVLKNVDRMSRLTEDLLVLARTEAPDRKPLRRSIAASTLIEDAVRNFTSDSARLTVSGATSTPVLADEIAVQQVLANLLENAAKYGRPSDGSEPRIEVAAEDTGNGMVLFRVRDFGPGIAMEHHSRLFERFYRVDKARSRESGGTGLGLAIARLLIEENGGTITLDSALGRGSEFRFTLPVASSAVGADTADEAF
ncbi:ATP-binding protein [Terriglobus aquaticus]|uniref:histidine kinase n=1 Tax=Terriglobus aquaticus TaxID=940139 RepID=A0ABW9KKN8_9BACT|nr:ATP-binding protein [Terriglobus aquaticus]